MNKIIATALALSTFLPAGQAAASSFTLNFGSVSASSFNDAANNVVDYGVVANDGVNDIYGQLTTLNAFASLTPTNNGSASGDVRVNAQRGETVQLSLSLFLDSSYSVAYTSASNYSWSLMFYDVDGIGSSAGIYGADANETNFYDEVLVRTTGTATFVDGTYLNYAQTDDGLLVNAEGQDHVAGEEGITSLNAEQQKYSFIYTVENTSTVLFDYSVEDLDMDTRQRNLLVDGGSLEFTSSTFDVAVAPVPLPGGMALMLVGFAAFGVVRRSNS